MKLLILFTGGTIGSAASSDRIALRAGAPRELLRRYRERTGDETVFDTAEPFAILSEEMTFGRIAELCAFVRAKLADYDGIALTHGSDTLAYTAAALSYALGLSAKPVVLVASNYVLSDPRADGVDHLIAAIALLRSGLGRGVYASAREGGDGSAVLLLRASRLLGQLPYGTRMERLSAAAFRYEAGTLSREPGYAERPDAIAPLPCEGLAASAGRVLWIHPDPGMRYPALAGDCGAVLHGSFHSGTVRADAALSAFLRRARRRGIPVFQAGAGTEALPYESALGLSELGMIPLPPASPLALYLKLSLALAAGLNPRTVAPRSLGGDLL